MKKLLLVAALFASGAAMASGPSDGIVIDGTSTQVAVLQNTTVSNHSTYDNYANQNLASNTNGVRVKDDSLQIVAARNSTFKNEALGSDSIASQNVSSNVGDVTIKANSYQVTLADGAYVTNLAEGGKSLAIQNIASNNACTTCTGVVERRMGRH